MYRLFFLTFFCIWSVGVARSHSTSSVSKKILFDDDWRFFQGDVAGGGKADYDDSNWRSLVLPHDYSIEGLVDKTNPMGNDGGYFPSGIGWYRKSFSVTEEFKGKLIGIYFEGVYMNAEVFINGVSLGVRPYGFSSFSHDLTPYINVGGVNVIAVKVDNSLQKNCRWYTGSGIYRHVWLTSEPQLHFQKWSGFVTSSDVDKNSATVKLSSSIINDTNSEELLEVVTVIKDVRNKPVSKTTSKLRVQKKSILSFDHKMFVRNPELWSPMSPTLYTATVSISKGRLLVDLLEIPFGIRSFSFSADGGFVLNGEKILINGGCIHHDNGALGAAAHDKAEYRKVKLLKDAGFNAVRTSHNPPSEAFLDACDEIGLLVIDESFDGWRSKKNQYDYAMLFDDWWEADVTSMVLRDRNHPSIIMWSTGNEIIERKEASAVNTAKNLVDLVKSLDPTRPVTSALTTWDSDWEIFDPLFAVHDIGGYNYQMHRALQDHKRVPERVILQTESYPRDAYQNWKAVSENPYIIGDFVWTAMDYIGESGIGRYFYKGETEGQHYDRDIYPWHGAYCGDIDLIGNRKPISHYRDMLYNKSKKLFLAVKEPDGYYGEIKETLWSVWPTWESWSWPGHEGKNIEVEVYSRYNHIKLYLNDKLIGEKVGEEIKEFKGVFNILYAPGELKAVGLEGGKVKESYLLRSVGKATNISLTSDFKTISADGSDICFIDVEVVDNNGVMDPNAIDQLEFQIDGPAKIIAVSNANLQDMDSYVGSSRKAWKGKAQVVVRSVGKVGDVTLSATSPTLKTASIKIQAK